MLCIGALTKRTLIDWNNVGLLPLAVVTVSWWGKYYSGRLSLVQEKFAETLGISMVRLVAYCLCYRTYLICHSLLSLWDLRTLAVSLWRHRSPGATLSLTGQVSTRPFLRSPHWPGGYYATESALNVVARGVRFLLWLAWTESSAPVLDPKPHSTDNEVFCRQGCWTGQGKPYLHFVLNHLNTSMLHILQTKKSRIPSTEKNAPLVGAYSCYFSMYAYRYFSMPDMYGKDARRSFH